MQLATMAISDENFDLQMEEEEEYEIEMECRDVESSEDDDGGEYDDRQGVELAVRGAEAHQFEPLADGAGGAEADGQVNGGDRERVGDQHDQFHGRRENLEW